MGKNRQSASFFTRWHRRRAAAAADAADHGTAFALDMMVQDPPGPAHHGVAPTTDRSGRPWWALWWHRPGA